MVVFHSIIPSLSISINIDGYVRYFRFTPKGRPYKYGYLYVDTEKEVRALKHHPDFGTIITIAEDDTPKIEEPEKTPLKIYTEVTKTQEAKTILKEEYDYPVEKITSKVAAKAAADELNISFPNL